MAPWDGSGAFSRTNGNQNGATLWEATRVAGRKIRTDDHDTHDEDLADGIQNCLTIDGQSVPTANLPMNSKRHTGVQDAVDDSDYCAFGQAKSLLASPIAFTAVTWASPLAWDVEAAARGTVTVTGDMSGIDLSNAADGGIYVLQLTQDSTGGHSMTWPTTWLWPGGEAPELTSDADGVDVLTLMRIGSTYYALLTDDWQTA